ncbi:MAG: hypothetical protein HYZ49_11230 [Chloroflexi bacterium]|nr:hypothetical protein [Chloroflexota bacterium]
MKRRHIVLFVSLLFVVALGSVAYWRPGAATAQGVLVQDYLDQEKTIQYIGNVDDTGSPFGVVMYDSSRPESLVHYMEASRFQGQKLISSGAKELYVWVTFRRPMNIDAFEALMKQNGLAVKRYTLRVIGQKGDRIGISGGPEQDHLVPADQIDSAMNAIQGHESNQAQLQGVFEVVGVVSAEGYQALIEDPRVFLVDVTGTLIYRDQNFQRKTNMGWKEFVDHFQIDGGPGGPFWYVEDFGLGASGN